MSNEYIMSEKELRQVQMIQLDLLKEVDRICRKHEIPYVIIAGTLLGAVRHKGYIPWDDDADVAFLRKDYERFIEACKTELNQEKYYVQDHNITPGYRWGYGKMRRKDTLFLRKNQEHMPYEQGIFIDLFPLDRVPQSAKGRALVNFHCFLIRKCMWAPIGAISEKNLLFRMNYRLLKNISDKALFGHFNRLIEKTNQKNVGSEWVRILTFPTPTSDYGYKRVWYENREKITFEGVEFYGIKDWDAYLRFKFGSYMELPPENQRKTHPVSQLTLIDG